MIKVKVALPYLEGLTTDELYALARYFLLDIRAGLDRNTLMKELVEFMPCLSLYQHPLHDTLPQGCFGESGVKPELEQTPLAPLPKQYHKTYINALVRDPCWVFVFWEIKAADRRKYEKAAGFGGYSLRVRLVHCLNEQKPLFHTAQIAASDTTRYVHFPPETACRKGCAFSAHCSFVVELCALIKKEARVISASNPFRLPAPMPAFGSAEEQLLHTPLLIQSGADALKVLYAY